MKKKQKGNSNVGVVIIICLLLIVIGVGAFFLGMKQSGCNGLVGTWSIDGNMMGVYEFRANGSGGYGVGDYMVPFVYKDYGTYFEISADKGESWTRSDYEIDFWGNKLTITEGSGRRATFTCTEK